jgi:BON domain
VTRRCRYHWAVLLGLSLAPAGWGQDQASGQPPPLGLAPGDGLPARVASTNQKMADQIADHLRQSGQLHQYAVDISYHDRTAVLTGLVGDQMQREEVLRLVQGVPGVDKVVDRLALTAGISRVQAAAPPPGPALPTLPAPMPEAGPPLNGTAPPPEPTPIFSAPPPSSTDLSPPRMPPYAWPTYAPYNNYSRVAYPLNYPYTAWPFIGPCYPFPKIPLGWRSVKLEWQDGHWWFSKVASPHDWWRVRYW